ncbi:Zinc finger protein 294 [Camponotus floridanus]|uniref:E3 ubiquitin-protein ligase listerin n=1 Tax=Camponotus floridanus TaxID=104421 RepID=E2AF87_CAMFO|nr:Zinc finger protein 294 [Camponotus floridanus]
MGKNKQTQRIKNNARPSNSSRSAELLGTAMPNYVGFSAIKDGGYVPVLPGLSLCYLNEGEINNVDSNFQVILKKMSKKDATTKYKALQEFATLCQEAELSIIESVLSFWPRLYCTLSIDIDHRVREAAQLAHAAVAKRVAKHDTLSIKIAFFNVLTSIMENAEKLLQNEKKRTLTTITNNLDETEPGILSAVWESMLIAITKIDDWYLVVNIDKFVLPKLWHVLRSGGQCCASTVYPNLLPFISQFSKLNVNINDLYMNFFDNMRQGFFVKSVQISRSETLAIVSSFIECLRYSILINVENIELCMRLLKEQLMFVIEACMTDSISMKQFCFVEVAHLIRYWSKNRINEGYIAYISLMQQFWIELRLLFIRLINISKEIVTSHTIDTKDSQIEFLLTLKNLPDRNHKKLKVRFSDSSPIASQSKVKIDIYTDTVFNAELCEFVNELCIVYFNNIKNQQSIKYVKQLNKLIKYFASQELFVALSKSFKFDKDFFEFYNNNLRSMLLKNSEIMEEVIELIFYFIKYTSDTKKNEVLKSLIELNDIAVTKNVIYCSLSERNRNDPIIKKWYIQTNVTKLLIGVAKEIASPGHNNLEKNQNLILLAFEALATGDLLINDEEANEIVSILCNSLNETNDNCSMQFITFITKLTTLIWSQKQIILSAVQILETFFELCTREYDDSIAHIVHNSWKEGLVRSNEILSGSEFNDLVKRCAIIIWSKVYNTCHIKDILVNLATDVLEIIINNNNINSHCINETILLFLTASDIKSWIAEATTIAIYGEIITGNLYISNVENKIKIFEHYMSIDITNDIISDNMTNCLSWALFVTDLLNNLYKRLRNSIHVNTFSDSSENFELYELNLPGITEILINIMHVTSIAEIYNKHYKVSKHYNDVNKLYDSLKSNFVNLEKYFQKNIHNDVLSHIQKNQSNYGFMLPYIIRVHYTEFKISDNPVKYYENCKNNEGEHDDETYVQAIQILNDYWMPENIPLLMNNDIHTLIVTRVATIKNDSSVYTTIIEKIMLYNKKDIAFLDHDISNISWNQLCLLLEVIRLLTALVQKVPSKLQNEHWDFILIALTTWQQLLTNFELNYTDIKIIALMIAINQLYYAVQTLMNKHEQERIPELPPTLLDEWINVFASCINSDIVKTWIFCMNLYNKDTVTLKYIIPLDCLGKSISILDKNILFKKYDKPSETINFNEMLKLCLKLLHSPILNIQLSAYHALKHMVSELVQCDKVLIESDNFEPNNFNIKRFIAVLSSTQNIVNTMLMEFKLCDTTSCTIQPFTDSYTYTLEYLLVWTIVLDMCGYAHSDLRYQYAEILKNDFFPCLLNNIFKLMPVEVLQDNKKKTAKLLEAFTTVPSFNFEESWTEWKVDHIVCWLYTNCLRHLPVLVRQWLSTADSKVSAIIDKITNHYISPMLCQEELNNRLLNVENMQIKVHPTTREVIALYQMDDTKLELSVVLPSNYPLGTVKVESGQHAGSTANWRNCHMQLSIFLTHQNGSIWDGLIMWKRNLDKKFAGVEECYICFSVFHINTYQIPKLSCHTCRKKFHTLCLYKWFNTSQKSTCPICRNVF